MPPHSFVLGHIPVLTKVLKSLPDDAHMLYLPTAIRQLYPELGPNFYLDLWPFSFSILVVGSPETLHQMSVEHPLMKNTTLKNFLYPLTGGLDIVSLNGLPWKKWRAVFNPGFSSNHVMTVVPTVVQEMQTFCQRLDHSAASYTIFPLKSFTDDLILDIIGQITLDVQWKQQLQPNQVLRSLRTQIKWLSAGAENNLLARYNPMRPLMHWYHGRIVDGYVSAELEKRFGGQQDPGSPKQNRTIIDLALKAYHELSDKTPSLTMDPGFKKICVAQLKIFLFAGHDTTSTAMCYHIWLLSQHPDQLARLRQEHDRIFGPDPAMAAQIITETPHSVNQLVYTTAVIKESLRMFTPVTSTRAGEAGFSVVDAQGRAYPTGDLVVWSSQHTAHYDPLYWPEPAAFMPERWLVDDGDPLHPIKSMWRPFEQGPRNCIGQELAMMEMKIFLVLVSRSYNFKPAYDELDVKAGRKQVTVMGTKAYQVDSMQPRGDMPIRVEKL